MTHPLDRVHRRMLDFEQYAKLTNVSRVLYFTPDEWNELLGCGELSGMWALTNGHQIVAMTHAGFTLRLTTK